MNSSTSLINILTLSSTYDHTTLKARLPVRSAIYKQCTGGLVVRWVTTSESPLLYVFACLTEPFDLTYAVYVYFAQSSSCRALYLLLIPRVMSRGKSFAYFCMLYFAERWIACSM
ncbi:hypothetical protein T440DRAFT_545879 [Plenodomus tracheiphilus IPT5]|uniref:Uncharacterized protein n=1 Tax=Plenodomus tracheiphilus IPT5 TaxID=1408161 RepID=A0A6A7BEM8_9PLEO|nr:hypothetical protein T440DRAFT_545879 [Plenodomus tracheiphilus IPT5]